MLSYAAIKCDNTIKYVTSSCENCRLYTLSAFCCVCSKANALITQAHQL